MRIPHFHPVIIAGGSGTRFWPLSRRRMPKQTLALDGKQTMVQQTVSRLMALASKDRFLVITGEEMAPAIRKQLKSVKPAQIIAEPVSRNTAPAIGLAAHILLRRDPEAVLGVFPADQTISGVEKFRSDIERAVQKAHDGGNVVIFGIPPDRPETGYGYVQYAGDEGHGIFRVLRFTEKPDAVTAEKFVTSGDYLWNGGMFFWKAQTVIHALERLQPEMSSLLAKIAATYGTAKFARSFKKLYSKCQNISIDYAVMEPVSRGQVDGIELFCLRAGFAWNDLGSWTSLHQHRSRQEMADASGNIMNSAGSYTLESGHNFIHAPGRYVALVGVEDLVVVETPDALLVTTRQRSQNVAQVVKHLSGSKNKKLL